MNDLEEIEPGDKTDPGFEVLRSDPDLTPPGASAGTFATVADAFWDKIRVTRDTAYFLSELINPADRDASLWRLAAALTEVIDVGTDLRALVITMVGEQPAVEI